MQLSQTMKLKESKLIIQTALNRNRKPQQKKPTLNILVYIGTIAGKHFSHFYYLLQRKEKKL